VLTVARPAPKVASSTAFAERRIEQGKRTPELATTAKPVAGLGAPRDPERRRHRSGDDRGRGRILGVSAPTVEAAEALAKKVIPHVR